MKNVSETRAIELLEGLLENLDKDSLQCGMIMAQIESWDFSTVTASTRDKLTTAIARFKFNELKEITGIGTGKILGSIFDAHSKHVTDNGDLDACISLCTEFHERIKEFRTSLREFLPDSLRVVNARILTMDTELAEITKYFEHTKRMKERRATRIADEDKDLTY